jgi:2-succinyl-6-hydroxy-2,4-cyclohexadiene-1-carboxylate synthase
MTPIVALHGFGLSPAAFDGVPAALAEVRSSRRARVCALTSIVLPGHAGTPPASFEKAVAGVACAVDTARARARGVVLWGYSLGARIALATAQRQDLAALVLESGTAGIANEVERVSRRALDDARARDLETRGLDAFFRDWDAQPLFASLSSRPDVVEKRRAMRAHHEALALAAALRAFSPGRVPSMHGVLAAVRVPTLLLCGERDARYVDEARALAAMLPNARRVVVAGCGHAPHLEDPHATAAAVRTFLDAFDVPPGNVSSDESSHEVERESDHESGQEKTA